MAFHHNLRTYLEARPAFAREIDEHALRTHVLERLRSLEHGAPPEAIAKLHEEWISRLKWYVRYVEHLPAAIAPTAPAEALRFATRLFDVAIERGEAAGSLVEKLELQRILRGYWDIPGLETYALENHLVAEVTERRIQLTQLGHTFLRLRGRDAIRWLVTSETLQSLGPGDLWHFSPSALAEAMTPQGTAPFHRGSLNRALEFGILTPRVLGNAPVRYIVPQPVRYIVPHEMRELIMAVLDHGPWHTAIRALLEDERNAALVGLVSTTVAVDAVIEQTRLMTHEVRNALVPVRHHLDALSGSGAESGRGRVEAARRGVVRVLDFVEQLVATTELITEPATSCNLADIVSEALERIEDSERVVSLASREPLLLRAPRHRLVLAVVNLVRNAIQAASAPAPIQVSWQRASQEARIFVDDGGAGVAPEDRERIFDDGFTTRPGGSGFGLAFTRRFIETALRGKVWCEGSNLGGARFVVAIPIEPTP